MSSSVTKVKHALENGTYSAALGNIYGTDEVTSRFTDALSAFKKEFGDLNGTCLFSSPGRTEICGNHTDHQGGVAIAATVSADIFAVVAPCDKNEIRITDSTLGESRVDLSFLSPVAEEQGTSASLIRGVAAYIKNSGRNIGGFCAYTDSVIPCGSGLSSSAAYELLVATVINKLYNNSEIPYYELAKAGQFAENTYYGKPSGTLDQTAIAHGGCIYIDFSSGAVNAIPFNPDKYGYRLMITNTDSSHADLSGDYAAIREEMTGIARLYGCENLSEIDEDRFFDEIGETRNRVGDRAILRAIHFFNENRRVKRIVNQVERLDFDAALAEIAASGTSSFCLLQNVHCGGTSQPLSLALALSGVVLGKSGVARVHGGGFAGTIQAYVPFSLAAAYERQMNAVFGENACRAYRIRSYPCVCFDDVNKEETL